MRKLATVLVSACVLASACGSGDKPRPAPVPAHVVAPETPTALPTREESHTSRVPDPGPTREPLWQPANRMERETQTVSHPPPPKPSLKPEVVPKTTTKAPDKPRPPSTSAPPTKPPVRTGNAITIGTWSRDYVTAFSSQKTVDECKVVEWDTRWIVGHNHCGYGFWASLGLGDTVTLSGKDAGTYTVTTLVYLPYQGGTAPFFTHTWDLVLQTCKGSGTQLVFAQKTG